MAKLTRLERLTIATAEAQARAEAARAEYDEIRKALVEAMDETATQQVMVIDPNAETAVNAKMVRSKTTRLNPDIIDALDETQRRATTVQVIDQEKLAAAVVLGVVPKDLVDEHTEVVERAPYVRVTTKSLSV